MDIHTSTSQPRTILPEMIIDEDEKYTNTESDTKYAIRKTSNNEYFHEILIV